MIEHLAQPGPQHWDWRCLRCSEPCDQHIGVFRWLFRKFMHRT